MDLSSGGLSLLKSTHYPDEHRFVQTFPKSLKDNDFLVWRYFEFGSPSSNIPLFKGR
ncbi:MAG: hypothetical protein K2Q97_15105 [Burkholderiaceae bacterium]|nr:hypothetical protein [Burkholderiaceae bacterium]